MANDNVVKVPPRRVAVHYKGLHGYVEYHPSTKKWTFTLKLLQRIVINGVADSLEEGKLLLKQKIEVAMSGGGKNISSED
jgi:hypothetical protein